MNCKPGDLAVVVRTRKSTENCLGKFITVHKLNLLGHWEYSPILLGVNEQFIHFAEDAALIPIRNHPDDAIDEVLAITGKPMKEPA